MAKSSIIIRLVVKPGVPFQSNAICIMRIHLVYFCFACDKRPAMFDLADGVR